MKRFLGTYLFMMALSVSLSAQEHSTRGPSSTPSGTWAKFISEEGRFSVLMPGIPTDEKKTVPSENGPYTTHLFVLREGKIVFLVAWVDYDPSFNFNAKQSLKFFRMSRAKSKK